MEVHEKSSRFVQTCTEERTVNLPLYLNYVIYKYTDMKLTLGIILFVGGALSLIAIIRKSSAESAQSDSHMKPIENLYSIEEGNQDSLTLGARIAQGWIDTVQAKYSWDTFDEYDNRMWQYMDKLFDETVENSGIQEYDELWRKLTREQKVFWAFLAFNGDVNNGGVYQFISNRPEFLVAVSEMFHELEMHEVAKDYELVLQELVGKAGKINELKSALHDNSKSWEKRWNSFTEGYKELQSTEKIESYYYDKEFRKRLYKKVADYIELHIDKFATVV